MSWRVSPARIRTTTPRGELAQLRLNSPTDWWSVSVGAEPMNRWLSPRLVGWLFPHPVDGGEWPSRLVADQGEQRRPALSTGMSGEWQPWLTSRCISVAIHAIAPFAARHSLQMPSMSPSGRAPTVFVLVRGGLSKPPGSRPSSALHWRSRGPSPLLARPFLWRSLG